MRKKLYQLSLYLQTTVYEEFEIPFGKVAEIIYERKIFHVEEWYTISSHLGGFSLRNFKTMKTLVFHEFMILEYYEFINEEVLPNNVKMI